MKVSAGCIPWQSKTRRVLLCIIVAICFLVLYHNYISGTIVLDKGIIRNVEEASIERNWERLVRLGFYVDHFDSSSNYSTVLSYQKGEADQYFDVDLIQIYIRSNLPTNTNTPNVDASYRRVGLIDAIWGLGSFGECTSRATIETDACVIYMVDYDDSDGTERRLSAALQTIIDVIE